MKKLFIPTILLPIMYFTHVSAQELGNGSISNYLINCSEGGPCEDSSNPIDSFVVTASDDGELKFTVTLTNGTVVCCDNNQTFNLIVTARLFPINNSTPLHEFVNNTTSEYTKSCVKKDDQFILIFTGLKGNYNYSTDLTPSAKANDPEPNDVWGQAKFLNANMDHEGRIGHGLYSRDIHDWYKVVADEFGRLKVNIDTDAGANFYFRNYLNLQVIATKLMMNAGIDSLVVSCVAPGDTIYLEVVARSNICAGYTLNYATISVNGTEDIEPNNSIAEAMSIDPDAPEEGIIGFGRYDTDVADYYKLTATSAGDLQIRLQFDDMINVRLYRSDNQQQFFFKLALEGGFDTLRIKCVEEGDMFFLKIEKDVPVCTSYRIAYSILNEPLYASDQEDNNSSGSAQEILNLPGTFSGRLNYGFYLNDPIDYYSLGLMEVNDRPIFSFKVSKDSINVRLERLSIGLDLVKDFGQISGTKKDSVVISEAGFYFLRVSSNACTSYEVDISGALSHVIVHGVDAMGLHTALQDIKVINSIAGPNTLLCTKEVIICPVFTVPLGHVFEVKIDP